MTGVANSICPNCGFHFDGKFFSLERVNSDLLERVRLREKGKLTHLEVHERLMDDPRIRQYNIEKVYEALYLLRNPNAKSINSLLYSPNLMQPRTEKTNCLSDASDSHAPCDLTVKLTKFIKEALNLTRAEFKKVKLERSKRNPSRCPPPEFNRDLVPQNGAKYYYPPSSRIYMANYAKYLREKSMQKNCDPRDVKLEEPPTVLSIVLGSEKSSPGGFVRLV